MAGIDIDGNSGIDMYPEETRACIAAAGQADTALNQNFTANNQRIDAFDDQLGQGPLGAAFAGQFNSSLRAVIEGIQQVHVFAGQMVDAGLQAVRNYEAGDLDAARALTLPAPLPVVSRPDAPGVDGEDPGTYAPQATPGGGR